MGRWANRSPDTSGTLINRQKQGLRKAAKQSSEKEEELLGLATVYCGKNKVIYTLYFISKIQSSSAPYAKESFITEHTSIEHLLYARLSITEGQLLTIFLLYHKNTDNSSQSEGLVVERSVLST